MACPQFLALPSYHFLGKARQGTYLWKTSRRQHVRTVWSLLSIYCQNRDSDIAVQPIWRQDNWVYEKLSFLIMIQTNLKYKSLLFSMSSLLLIFFYIACNSHFLSSTTRYTFDFVRSVQFILIYIVFFCPLLNLFQTWKKDRVNSC
jgi:hypothetical protein